MEVSNKALAWFVVAAVAVSIIGTGISLSMLGKVGLTGYATSNVTGNASVLIASQTSLRYAIQVLNFGSGSVDTSGGYNNCTLTANNSVNGTLVIDPGCLQFNNETGQAWPLILENAGNTYMTVTLNFTENATTFPGGNPIIAAFQYQIDENETDSCEGSLSATSWTNVVALTQNSICSNLSWNDTKDTLKVNLKVVIPNDADGQKDVDIIAQGTSLP